MKRKRKASETRALKQIRKPAVRIHRAATIGGRACLLAGDGEHDCTRPTAGASCRCAKEDRP